MCCTCSSKHMHKHFRSTTSWCHCTSSRSSVLAHTEKRRCTHFAMKVLPSTYESFSLAAFTRWELAQLKPYRQQKMQAISGKARAGQSYSHGRALARGSPSGKWFRFLPSLSCARLRLRWPFCQSLYTLASPRPPCANNSQRIAKSVKKPLARGVNVKLAGKATSSGNV